jgi:CTP:molybdopterin cytidylyltransferase MocA
MQPRVAGILLAAGEGSRLGQPKALVEIGGQRLVDRGVLLLRAGGADPIIVVTGAAPADVPGALVVHNPEWSTGMSSSLTAGLSALCALSPEECNAAECSAAVIALADQPLVTPECVKRLIASHRGDATTAVGPDRADRPSAAGTPSSAGTPSAIDGPSPAVGPSPAGTLRAADGPGAAVGPSAVDDTIVPGALGATDRTSPSGGACIAVAAYGGRPRNPVLIAREHWTEVLTLAHGDAGARPFLRAHPDLVTLVECGDVGRPDDIDTPEDLARVTEILA